LVTYEAGWLDRLSGKQIQRERNQAIAVLFGKVCDGSNQVRTWFPHLGSRLGLGVLADNRAVRTPACFLESAYGAESAWIIHRPDQDPRGLGSSQMPSNHFECGLELAVGVHG